MNKKCITTWGLIAACAILFSIFQTTQAASVSQQGQMNRCGPLSQEAENGQLFGGMQIGENPKASGGKFVFTSREIEGSDSLQDSANKVEFCVDVPKNGDYQIKTWVYARDSARDSMFVAVDGLPSAGYLWGAVTSNHFSEDFVSDRNKSDPQTITLTAGSHTITFANRESETRLDRFELILVNEYPGAATVEPTATQPSATEPARPTAEPTQQPEENKCAGLEQEAEQATLFGKMQVGQAENASGQAFIYVPSQVPNSTDTINPEHRAEFCVNVPENGTYQILAWAQAANSKQDSFYVSLDQAPAQGYLWQPPTSKEFTEDFIHDRGKNDPQLITLTKGEHLLTVFHRESETRLDKFKFELVASSGEPAPPEPTAAPTETAESPTATPIPAEPTQTAVPPTPTPIAESSACGGMLQEAEAGTLFGKMKIGSDKDASGGKYVYAPTSVGKSTNSINLSHRIDFCMTLPKAGDYKIIGRVQAANNNSDSFYVAVDGLPTAGYIWDIKRSSAFINDAVNNRGKTDTQLVSLTAGEHTLSVFHREPDAKLDRIEFVFVQGTGEGAPIEVTLSPTNIPPAPTSTATAMATAMATNIPPTATPLPLTPTPMPTATKVVTPTPQPTAATCSGLTQEAESAALFGRMVIGYDGGASGGRYIFTPKSVAFATGLNQGNYAEFCVNIPEDGDYQIEALVKAPDDQSDSLYVTVDGGPTAGYLWDVTNNNNFVTDLVNNRGKSDPQTIYLAKGERKIAFHHRESGTLLDKITLIPVSGSGGVTPTIVPNPTSTPNPTATPVVTPVATPTTQPPPSSGKVAIGMSDLPQRPSMFRLPAGVTYRQQYLSGGAGKGWSTWNANGDFVKYYIQNSQQLGKSSIFTLYHICQSGYDNVSNHPCYSDEAQAIQGNMSNQDTMRKYWDDLKLFYERAAEFPNHQVILHVEPDLWGYLQKGSAGDNAANYSQTVQVSGSGHPDLGGLPNTALGFAEALFHLRDVTNADNVLLAYHVSSWGNNTDFVYTDPSQSEMQKMGDRSATFYKSLKQPFDLSFFEIRDRDAGFYEFVYGVPNAWWTSIDFDNHITYIDRYSGSTNQSIMLWQLPYGNTKRSELDNSYGKYKDNIVETLLAEPNLSTLGRYQAAGVEALIFGQGAGGTTCPCDADGDGRLDDDGYFYDVVDAYIAR